jgi:hypothetical protein
MGRRFNLLFFLLLGACASLNQVDSNTRQPAGTYYNIFLDDCEMRLLETDDFLDELAFQLQFQNQFGSPTSSKGYDIQDLSRDRTQGANKIHMGNMQLGGEVDYISLKFKSRQAERERFFLLEPGYILRRCTREELAARINQKVQADDEENERQVKTKTAGIVYRDGDPLIIKEDPKKYAPFAHWFDGQSPKTAMETEYEDLKEAGKNRDEVFRKIGERMRFFVDVTAKRIFESSSGKSEKIGNYEVQHVMDTKGIQSSPWGDAHWSSGMETLVTHIPSGRKIRINMGTAHMAMFHQVLEKGAENIYACSMKEFLDYFLEDLPPYSFPKGRYSESRNDLGFK